MTTSQRFKLSRRQWIVASGLSCMGLPPAQAHEYYAQQFTLIHPWTEPTLPGQTQARVRFSLQSISGQDRLLGAQFAFCAAAELRSGTDDTAAPLPWIDIQPGERMNFDSNGHHVLLKGLTMPLLHDRSYPLAFRFEKSGVLNVMMSMGSMD
jgi:copper(I)-binding protein